MFVKYIIQKKSSYQGDLEMVISRKLKNCRFKELILEIFFLKLTQKSNDFLTRVTLKILRHHPRKKRRRAWTPGRFCEVASHRKAFSFFFLFLKKISINCRFFTQKEHLPAQKKEVLHKKITSYLPWFCKTKSRSLLTKNTYLSKKKKCCTKKIMSYLLWFCKTNSQPLLKKNIYLPPQKNFCMKN